MVVIWAEEGKASYHTWVRPGAGADRVRHTRKYSFGRINFQLEHRAYLHQDLTVSPIHDWEPLSQIREDRHTLGYPRYCEFMGVVVRRWNLKEGSFARLHRHRGGYP